MKIIRAGLGLMLAVLVGTMAMAAAEKTKSAAASKADEAPAKIGGLEIPRPTGAFLGLEIVHGNFVLTFYDAQKEKMPIDVARATLRWPVKYRSSDERLVLNPGSDGMTLTSERIIRPPHNFRIAIGLYVEGNDDPVEFYNVNYP